MPSPIPNEQIAMGGMISLLCLWGLCNAQWFLQHSSKGKWLENSLGTQKALWVIRLLFAGGSLFGIFLALNVIRPMSW